MKFIPLNVISSFSILQSAIDISSLISHVKKFSYASVGIADINVVFSYPQLSEYAAKNEIKPLFGIRSTFIYLDNTVPIVLYIKDEEGYENLCHLLDESNGSFTLELIKQYYRGLVAIIPSNQNFLFADISNNLLRLLVELDKIFAEDLYVGIEIYSSGDVEIFSSIRQLLSQHNFKMIAFPLIKYIEKFDAQKMKIIEAITDNKQLNKDDFGPDKIGGPYFLLSPTVVEKLYEKTEIDLTQEIADKCTFDFIKKRGKFINFENPKLQEELHARADKNLCEMLNLATLPHEYSQRLSYELSVVEKMGYLNYFTLVEDYVSFAKRVNIPVGPGRGSAAGSLLSYGLKITAVDPLKFNLIFERFLNPMRQSMPDIDIDFSDERRDEIITYLKQAYGESRVANIITFSTIRPKKAIRDIGKIFSFGDVYLEKMIKLISVHENSFADIIKNNNQFRELIRDEFYQKLYYLSSLIEGIPRQISMHAAGVIVNDEQISRFLPRVKEYNNVTSFDMNTLEKLGYLKIDILGLQNLSFIEKIENEIIKNHHSLPDISSALDHEEIYRTLNNLLLVGIFQLESPGIKKAIMQIKPSSFADLYALIALYRPGPMEQISSFARRKNGHEEITYLHPLLKPILESTYGIFLYQEQIIEVAKVIAKFDAAKADYFRSAISKKKEQQMISLKKDFLLGAAENNIDEKVAIEIFSFIEKFANYGFNKAHSVSYALISHKLLYYKTFFAKEFYCVLLDKISPTDEKFTVILQEMNSLNIKLYPLNINESEANFSSYKDGIIYPLSMIKTLNQNHVQTIIDIREKYGKFDDYRPWGGKLITADFTFNQILALISSGACDIFSHSRATLKKLDAKMLRSSIEYEDSLLDYHDQIDDIYQLIIDEYAVLQMLITVKLSDYAANYAPAFGETLLLAKSECKAIGKSYLISALDEHNEYSLFSNRHEEVKAGDLIVVTGYKTQKKISVTTLKNLGRIK